MIQTKELYDTFDFYYLLLPSSKIKRHKERLRDVSYKPKCSVTLAASCSFHAHLEKLLLFVAKYFLRRFLGATTISQPFNHH